MVTAHRNPHSEYERRLSERRETVSRGSTLDNRLATARGFVFLGSLALLAAAYQLPALSAAWLLLPLSVFVVLVVVHSRVAERLARDQRAVEFYEMALRRLDDDWMDCGALGERYADAAHAYSGDLDLFGRGSLFQLISTSRTRLGEDALAKWLLHPADIETVQARQSAVGELSGMLDLREELALLDAEVRDEFDQNRLVASRREFVSRKIDRPLRRTDVESFGQHLVATGVQGKRRHAGVG